MWKKMILLELAGLFLTGRAFTPSQLNANPARYSGIIVVVRGFVKLAPETHVLYESKTLNSEVQRVQEPRNRGFDRKMYAKYCVTIANPELLYKNRAAIDAKTLIFQGKFIDDYQSGKTVDRGACPLPTAIMIDYAALVRRYPSLRPQ
jgi:hypothetical protein